MPVRWSVSKRKYLKQHIELSQKTDKDIKELNQFYKLAQQAEDYKL